MIAFLDGTVAGKTPSQAYLEVAGVGYGVTMAASALSQLPPVGERARVLTYLQVSENGIALYGFLKEEEKALFEKLIGVSGVGPKVALAALSTYSPAQLANAVTAQDIAMVQKIPGVGKKTASRIVLELKGSLESTGGLFDSPEAALGPGPAASAAREALLSMGFTQAEADLALKGAPSDATEAALIQYALKRLGS